MNGLRMVVFWEVNYLFDLAVYCLIVGVMLLVLYVGEVDVVLQTSPIIIIVVLFCWGHAMISMAYFCSVFFDRTLTAAIFGVWLGACLCFRLP